MMDDVCWGQLTIPNGDDHMTIVIVVASGVTWSLLV